MPAANDTFAGATAISLATPLAITDDTSTASSGLEASEPIPTRDDSSAYAAYTNTLWYTLTLAATTDLVWDFGNTAASGPILTLWSGSSLATLTRVHSSDNWTDVWRSVPAGSYHLSIAEQWGGPGVLDLALFGNAPGLTLDTYCDTFDGPTLDAALWGSTHPTNLSGPTSGVMEISIVAANVDSLYPRDYAAGRVLSGSAFTWLIVTDARVSSYRGALSLQPQNRDYSEIGRAHV